MRFVLFSFSEAKRLLVEVSIAFLPFVIGSSSIGQWIDDCFKQWRVLIISCGKLLALSKIVVLVTSKSSKMNSLTFLLVSLLGIGLVATKSCDILENFSCQCHPSTSNNQSEQLKCVNYYTPINGSIKLTNGTLEQFRSFDSIHLTFHTREMNITPMFINEISYIFSRSSPLINVILTFQDYLQLNFEDYAFYSVFPDQTGRLSTFSLELTASGQLTFAPMAFHQLTVDQMSIHSSSLEPYSFEELFNNTKIGSLTIEGCTPRSNVSLQHYFTGKIRSAKLTKMAEIVSSEEFPSYPVRSLTIEAHEPRQLNASTFISYHNLHGVHLIRPKFFFDNRSFDGFQYLPNLDTLELDAETIKGNTFQHTNRIRYFVLGANVRYLFDHSFAHLDYLTRFDLSKVILDQLYPSSKCILARYLQKQQRINPSMIIFPPQAEFCDCVYDFILHLVKKKAEHSYLDLCQSTQAERCQLSECDVIKHFRFPSNDKPSPPPSVVPSMVDENFFDSRISFYPVVQTPSTTQRPAVFYPPIPVAADDEEFNGSSFADTQVSHPVDPNAIPTDDESNSVTKPKSQSFVDAREEEQRLKRKNFTLKWISLSLLSLTVISVLLVGTLIWYYSCRSPSNKGDFQPISSNV